MSEEKCTMSDKCKELLNKARGEITTSVMGLRNEISDLKMECISAEKKRIETITDLQQKLTNSEKRLKELEIKKENMLKEIHEGENKVILADKENSIFQNQHVELKDTHEELTKKWREVEDAFSTISNKLSCLKNRRDYCVNEQKGLAEKYRKYLGLDIYRIGENTVKVIFTKLKEPCFLIFCFNDSLPVISVEPEIGVDFCNNLFTQEKNFFSFLKIIRREFIRKLK